jgi:hypothetical protein
MIEYEQYNGWTNQETWAMNFWLTRDPDYDHIIPSVIEDYPSNRQAQGLYDYLRDDFEWRDWEASPWRDLVGVSLSRVNWQEVIDWNKRHKR